MSSDNEGAEGDRDVLIGSTVTGEESEELHHLSRHSSASYITTEYDGEEYPTSQPETRQPTKTAKRQGDFLGPPSKKRILRQYYSEDYREFFNSSLAEFRSGQGFGFERFGFGTDSNWAAANDQHGIVQWTPDEKERFFEALARFSRDNVRGIATHVGTKSVIEVHEYIQLLHRTLVNKHLHEPGGFELSLTDLPVAHEISDECSTALENAADALALHQEEYEHYAEKERHGDCWRLDRSIAKRVHDQIVEAEESVDDVSKTIPAVALLNLLEWISLSENVFMNSGMPSLDSNWRSLADDDDETPSFTHTAFSDFHALTISVTTRIVQTVLYCAESRIRASSNDHYKPGRNVTVADVTAALDILKMKHSKFDFWIGAARRNHVEVQDRARRETLTGRVLSYEEVEKSLREPIKRPNRKRDGEETPVDTEDRTPAPNLPKARGGRREGAGRKLRPAWALSQRISPLQVQADDASPAPSPPPSPCTAQAQLQDMKDSQAHESFLWTDVLQQTPPPYLDHADAQPDIADEALRARRSREDITDLSWRDRVARVGAAWEAMGSVVSNEEFEEMARLGRVNFEMRKTMAVDDGEDGDEDVSDSVVSSGLPEDEGDERNHRSERESEGGEMDLDIDADVEQSF